MSKIKKEEYEIKGEFLFDNFFGGEIDCVKTLSEESILDSFPAVYENKTFIKSLYLRMYRAMRGAAITPKAEERNLFLGQIQALNSILKDLREVKEKRQNRDNIMVAGT